MIFDAILKAEPIRRRLAFGIRHGYFEELNIAAPIGMKLKCPIVNPEYWWSFEEVFFSDEYRPVFKQIPLPNRWLDLGCHAGFFSLLMILERRKEGRADDFQALLVDGDSRVERSIEAIGRVNKLGGQLKFLHGAIASKPGELVFEESSVMSSSVKTNGEGGQGARRVKVIRPEDIAGAAAGSYDLVKVDIEGAEHDFLTSYEPILKQTRHLLLEWHSWHFGGGGLPAIREAAAHAGFTELSEVVASHPVEGEGRTCGVILLERTK